MKKPTPRKTTQRAAGKTATSISLSEDMLEKAKEAAAKDGRSLSNWLEQLIKNSVKLIIFLILLAKLMSDPTDWSAGALAQAVGTGCIWFGQGVAWVVSGAWQVGGALLASL